MSLYRIKMIKDISPFQRLLIFVVFICSFCQIILTCTAEFSMLPINPFQQLTRDQLWDILVSQPPDDEYPHADDDDYPLPYHKELGVIQCTNDEFCQKKLMDPFASCGFGACWKSATFYNYFLKEQDIKLEDQCPCAESCTIKCARGTGSIKLMKQARIADKDAYGVPSQDRSTKSLLRYPKTNFNLNQCKCAQKYLQICQCPLQSKEQNYQLQPVQCQTQYECYQKFPKETRQMLCIHHRCSTLYHNMDAHR